MYSFLFTYVNLCNVGVRRLLFSVVSSLRYAEKYGRSDTINNYLRQCIMKLEEIGDIQIISNVLNKFFQR